MVEFNDLDEFVKISYEGNCMTVDDKYDHHMIFFNLPEFVFEEFEKSGFSYDYLENNIIDNRRLDYKKTVTSDRYIYNRWRFLLNGFIWSCVYFIVCCEQFI